MLTYRYLKVFQGVFESLDFEIMSVNCILVFLYWFQMVFAGMMCSSSIWGSICDKYGRKFVSISR